jgi:endogenous inhibitor of DNA gyrase (YacG/DUF329 family)
MSTITEARCPECGEWSRVAPTGPFVVPVADSFDPLSAHGDAPTNATGIMYGPWWWTDEQGDANDGPAGCPKCGATVMVESECTFQTVDPLEQLRGAVMAMSDEQLRDEMAGMEPTREADLSERLRPFTRKPRLL